MLNTKPSDRALPTFITLLVIGVLLMTDWLNRWPTFF